MPWTERQRAMLAEMGLAAWLPRADAPAPAAEAGDASGEPPSHPGARALQREPSSVRAFQPPAPPANGAIEARADAGSRAGVATAMTPSPPAPASGESMQAVATPVLDAGPVERLPGDVTAMDWQLLRDTVAGCTACALSTGRRQTVFGVGHPRAHWMIVGEAPGEQEDREGEPFVGKSGQLLDNMLRAIGLSRHPPARADGEGGGDPARQVYIANTIKCRPPGNRNPAPDELAQCEPYLMRQIALVQPRIIVAMGRFAVHQLLRSSEPIGRLRGRVHQYEGVPLVVTYHPAYLLRNLADKARAWEDLCFALETIRLQEPATAGT